MRKFLKRIGVIQEYDNQKNKIKKGRGFFKSYRINPYNPLSYIVVILIFIFGIIFFGIIGFWKQTDSSNPFKWN